MPLTTTAGVTKMSTIWLTGPEKVSRVTVSRRIVSSPQANLHSKGYCTVIKICKHACMYLNFWERLEEGVHSTGNLPAKSKDFIIYYWGQIGRRIPLCSWIPWLVSPECIQSGAKCLCDGCSTFDECYQTRVCVCTCGLMASLTRTCRTSCFTVAFKSLIKLAWSAVGQMLMNPAIGLKVNIPL